MMPRWASHCGRGIGFQSYRRRIRRNFVVPYYVRHNGQTCLADSWRFGYKAFSDHGSGACSYQPLQAAEPSESQGRDATAREHEFAGNAISGRTGAPQFSHRHFYLPLAAGFAPKKGVWNSPAFIEAGEFQTPFFGQSLAGLWARVNRGW